MEVTYLDLIHNFGEYITSPLHGLLTYDAIYVGGLPTCSCLYALQTCNARLFNCRYGPMMVVYLALEGF